MAEHLGAKVLLKKEWHKIQEKLHDKVESFKHTDQRQKIQRFISHIDTPKKLLDELSSDLNVLETYKDVDKPNEDEGKDVDDKKEKEVLKISIGKVLSRENFGVHLKGASAFYKNPGISISDNNLPLMDDNSQCSGGSNLSISSMPLNKLYEEHMRETSLPPAMDVLPPAWNRSYTDVCHLGELLKEKCKESGQMIHGYLLRSTRLADVNKRLKAQIWSSVVTIVLVEAKNLSRSDGTSSSDPYLKFRLGNEKYKSKVVWKSASPSWLEQFDLHLYDDQEQILELTVWDKDKQTKDDFLGRGAIDLSRLERETTHSIWVNLEEGHGKVFLLLTISGTTQSETITDLTTYHENPRDILNIEKRYAWYRLNEPASNGVGWLCVKVHGAKGLAAADLGGKSDPFCVLELGNARLQTHTEYKTLAPNWMKIFTFTIKDITSILEITVYDEDHDHKVEFLGRLCIPLLGVQCGEKRWYSLKDKKMRARAKGIGPQILLEMIVVWNPVKAAIRALNPKEEKYMQPEAKFKRQVFIRNVMRLKSIIMWFIEVGKILQDCFEWESRVRSFFGLMMWLVFCYNFEMWMVPVLILMLFGRNWLIYRLTGGNPLMVPVDDEELLAEEDDDDPEADKEEKKSLKERLHAIQEVTQTVQNAIGYVASLGEAVKNLVNFTVPYLSYLAILLMFAASCVLYLIPLRYLLMAWGINKFTRKILRPHSIPNNEVLDLLSRVPDDEILLDCRELKPPVTTEHRREARKKHKAS